jgi:protein TonB
MAKKASGAPGRSRLVLVSLALHGVAAGALCALPARVRHEILAISFESSKKAQPQPEPPRPADPPPRTADPPPPAARAKAAPPKRAPDLPKPAAADAPAPAPAGADALPDFGVSLSGTAGAGLAIPAGGAPAASTAASAPKVKTLARSARPALKDDGCDEPPAKPKLVSRPTPSYTEAARAAGVSGKVRVEITVDEHGRVASVRLVEGLGHGLDESALAAARGMTFEPAIRCGKPSASTFRVGFAFAPAAP